MVHLLMGLTSSNNIMKYNINWKHPTLLKDLIINFINFIGHNLVIIVMWIFEL
jgi:hypothetical protein